MKTKSNATTPDDEDEWTLLSTQDIHRGAISRVGPAGFGIDSAENLSISASFDAFVSPIVSPGVKLRALGSYSTDRSVLIDEMRADSHDRLEIGS
jgi:hypothetical protein